MTTRPTVATASGSRPGTLAVAGVTAACALPAVLAAWWAPARPDVLPLAAGLTALLVAALLRPVEPAPGTKVTLAGAVSVFAVCVMPGLPAVGSALVATVLAKLLQRASLPNLSVNAAKAAGASGAAGLVVLWGGPSAEVLALAGLLHAAVTLAAVGTMVRATSGAAALRKFLGREALPTATLAATGTIGALLWSAAPVATLLLVLPLAMVERAARASAASAAAARSLAGALEAQQAFAADAAHELRTPLTALRGNLGYIDATQLPADERDALAGAKDDLARLLALIERLLTLARVGGSQVVRRGVDLAAEVREAARLERPREGVKLSCSVPQDLLVAVPQELLGTVLRDLISNAVTYTLEGSVHISARASGTRAVLTVTDTGIGLDDGELQRAFERFFRGARARRLAAGSGLGLAIARRIVELHGGALTLTSRPERGTTATLELPLFR